MDKGALPHLIVVPIPSFDKERFAIVGTDGMLVHFARSFARTSTTEERVAAVAAHLNTLPTLSETEVRAELMKRGVTAAEVANWIARARRLREIEIESGSGAFVFERITRIGYVNHDGQEVIRRTNCAGPENQRVFVMRCRVCGHEYGGYGCDIDIRLCPKCQDGLPGLPTDDAKR